VGASRNCKENNTKNKCIVKKTSFFKILTENPVPLNMHLRNYYDTAWICHCWKSGRYLLQNASGNPKLWPFEG